MNKIVWLALACVCTFTFESFAQRKNYKLSFNDSDCASALKLVQLDTSEDPQSDWATYQSLQLELEFAILETSLKIAVHQWFNAPSSEPDFPVRSPNDYRGVTYKDTSCAKLACVYLEKYTGENLMKKATEDAIIEMFEYHAIKADLFNSNDLTTKAIAPLQKSGTDGKVYKNAVANSIDDAICSAKKYYRCE